MIGRKRKPTQRDVDIFDDFDDFGDTASTNEATGLIPGNNAEETASEFYNDVFDYLPRGAKTSEKYTK